jgi:hypothetical protein
MHNFIYPNQDTYINNSTKYKNKNFGLDEILEVYAGNDGYKLVYSSPDWHPVPETTSSYGNEGWLAYSTSSIYIYSGSKWRTFNLSSSYAENSVRFANFTGRLSNKITDTKLPLYISGSSTNATGSISGSMNIKSYSYISGVWDNTGSFSGSVLAGATFTYLEVDNVEQSSPLASTVTGTGSFIKLSGTIHGKANTGIPCSSSWYEPVGSFDFGKFSGSFSGSDFSAYIQTQTSSVYSWVDVINYTGYFIGEYSGSFAEPTYLNYLIRPEITRTLIKFDINSLSQSISNNTISGSDVKFTLNLKACGSRNLPLNYTLYAYPLSASWNNGNGRYADDGSQLGASWNYKDYYENNLWYRSSISSSYPQVNYLTDSQYGSSSFQNQGGIWYYNVPSSYTDSTNWICSSSAFPSLVDSSLICSQSFSYGEQSDVSMDITNIVRSWLCGCVPNNGLILMTSLEIATPPLQRTNGLLQFFSKESNTIYSPYIDVAWDDSIFETGSLAPVTGSTENLISLQYVKGEYKAGSLPKIFVFARDKYPLKQFNKAYQQPSMVTPKYLPTSSYYMIKDAESEEVIVGFDNYTKLSCDATRGNYFKLQTTGLPQERYYKIFIKTEYSDGSIDITDTEKVFKIVR